MTATQELVVPRSIPIILPIYCPPKLDKSFINNNYTIKAPCCQWDDKT
jgi:hypothetical protein